MTSVPRGIPARRARGKCIPVNSKHEQAQGALPRGGLWPSTLGSTAADLLISSLHVVALLRMPLLAPGERWQNN